MKMNWLLRFNFIILFCAMQINVSNAQSLLETGGRPMPDEWIDRDTHHKIIRLTRRPGNNLSFYFHNDPFIRQKSDKGDLMVFYGTNENRRNLYTVNLRTLSISELTNSTSRKSGEITGGKNRSVYYQVNDSVFSTNVDTRETKLLFVFPENFKGTITTLNANETLLGGVRSTDEEKEIARNNPEKRDYFNLIYEARLPRTLFTIDVKSKQLKKVFTDSAWLNHVQFSPNDPSLLMFCHEGPWHKVDRIWTINVNSGETKLVHKRTMDMEIFGHEWFSPDGKTIWFDLQLPRGKTFYVAGNDLKSGKEKRYALERDEWSIHYTLSQDQKLFAGDGGDSTQVARAKNGRWIYLFHPEGEKFRSEKLVNMKHHNYKLEPNVHFSPDGKWIIFRANFEGKEDVYAVEIKNHD
jgi:oligogalacturonide lyase